LQFFVGLPCERGSQASLATTAVPSERICALVGREKPSGQRGIRSGGAIATRGAMVLGLSGFILHGLSKIAKLPHFFEIFRVFFPAEHSIFMKKCFAIFINSGATW